MEDKVLFATKKEDYITSVRAKSTPLFEMTAQLIDGRKRASDMDGSDRLINGRFK
jgi:hypothetical protein